MRGSRLAKIRNDVTDADFLSLQRVHSSVMGTAKPSGSVLIIRPGISFWIARDPHALTSTISAFDQGVFQDAVCFDRSEYCWTVVEATLEPGPSLSDRLLPWRRVAVSVVFGSARPSGLEELKSLLCHVVGSGNEFVDTLTTDPDTLRHQIEATDSFETLIAVLRAAVGESPAGQ